MEEELLPISHDQPPKTLSEQLTRNFYSWEKRGRGWQVFDYPVELEPPYEPFFHYALPWPGFDDGRVPGFTSKIADRIRAWFSRANREAKDMPDTGGTIFPEDLLGEASPYPFSGGSELSCLRITMPPEKVIIWEQAEQFLLSLGQCVQPLSFEIIGLSDAIFVQFVCRESDFPYLYQQLRAYFPDVIAVKRLDLLKDHWDQRDQKEKIIVEFGLSQEFMLPIHTIQSFKVDPLMGIMGALSNLREEETALLQILFQATANPWAESISRAVLDWEGKPFFLDAPQIVPLAREKISRPLFAVVIRVAAQSPENERAWRVVKALTSALSQFADPSSNEFIPLDNENYLDEDHEEDLLLRQCHRLGMLLSSEELTSLAHLPSTSVQVEKLQRETRKTKAAPEIASGHDLILGENFHAEKKTIVTLSPDHRIKHTYVIGASGTGKSTLLLNMIVQDMKNGQGLAVLDPHGDLIDQVLNHVPEERFDDVIIFDPSDEQYPVGFNILQSHSEIEKNLLSSDLVALFRRLSTSWGDQMTSVLGNAILAFLESEKGGTLFDLRRFLIEEDFRDRFLQTVRDPQIVYYWKKEFPLLKYRPQASILTRLDTFLRPRLIRNIVVQRENRLDFKEIMDQQKIFLAKLAQGTIGEENSYLLGTLLVSAIHKVTLGRQEISQAKRRNFYLYIDEFQNFITPSMAAVLSGARKYRLGLVLAHQELQQLFDRDRNVASAVISNPYTRICFRLGESDARRLRDGFSFYEPRDLQNLGIGEAICRIERADYDFNLKTYPLEEIDPDKAGEKERRLYELSRKKYATKRSEIEDSWPREAALRGKEEIGKEEIRITERIEPEKERRVREPIPTEIIDQAEKEVLEELPEPSHKRVREITEEVRSQRDKLLGRGGPRHKYLQQILKRYSEEKGYQAIIEKILPSGAKVDVSLEKGEKKIACQVSLASTDKQEIHNIKNCLAGGYDRVILISTDKRILKKAKDLGSKEIETGEIEKVSFFNLEEFFEFFDKEVPKEEVVAGYKVKVRHKPLPEHEERARRQTISKVILKSLKKMKGQ